MGGKRRVSSNSLVADGISSPEFVSGKTSQPEAEPQSVPKHKRVKCGKSKASGGGWANFRATTLSEFAAGPANIEELFDWPTSTVDSIMGLAKFKHRDVLMDNLERHMQYGVDIVTDYSGMDCPRWCLEPVEEALTRSSSRCRYARQKRKWARSFKFHRSCDKGRLQKHILKTLAEQLDDGRTCVFEDLLDRLPEAARNCLSKMTPHDKASNEEKRLAYCDIRSWLHVNHKWCYPPDAESYCIVHQTMCKAFPVVPLQ